MATDKAGAERVLELMGGVKAALEHEAQGEEEAPARQPVETPPPGIYHGVPDRDYFRWGAVSQSLVVPVIQSAATWRERRHVFLHGEPAGQGHPHRIDSLSKDATKFGQAMHQLCANPNSNDIVLRPTDPHGKALHAGSNAYRDAEKELLRRSPRVWVCTPAVYYDLMALRDFLWEDHPVTKEYLEGADDRELSLRWDESVTARRGWDWDLTHNADQKFERVEHVVPMRGRLDLWIRGDRMLDWKFLRDISPQAFRKASQYDRRYDVQDVTYRRGAMFNDRLERLFTFACVRKERPFDVAFYEFTGPDLNVAESNLDAALEQWATCEVNGHWPGYPTRPQSVTYSDSFREYEQTFAEAWNP